jgi:general secretion pathway protein H
MELVVVVALIAVATAGVSLSLRDSAADALERDAQRLAAVLESARAQSRASGAAVHWLAQGNGFALQGLPRMAPAQNWLSEHTRVQSAAPVVLGPEPLIPPQRIELYSAHQPQQRLWVGSDGLQPFAVLRSPQGNAP